MHVSKFKDLETEEKLAQKKKRSEMKQLNLSQQTGTIMEEVLSLEQLHEAYQAVRRNKGAPGVDDITVEEFGVNLKEELERLRQEVKEHRYVPHPVRKVEIPKPGTNKKRQLGIPCIRDRVLQYSLKMSLEPLFEKKFSENSFGFRPKRSQRQAVAQAKEYVKAGKEYVVDIDLAQCFDRLNHDKIIHLLKQEVKESQVLRLIGLTLRSGTLQGDEFTPSSAGATQGSPLSPLLSNIVLDELDKELEARGHSFCRYADDCNIFVTSEKAANRVLISVTNFIEKRMKLVVNKEKSKTGLSKFVKFLGMTIIAGTVAISEQSLARANERVRELTPRRTHIPLEHQIKRINSWYQGWVGYYQMTEYPSQLRRIEAHIRRRLRAQLIRNQKRQRHLYRKFISMGIQKKTANKAVYSNKGVWAQSITYAANNAWNNRWFSQQGLITYAEKELPHWMNISTLAKFI